MRRLIVLAALAVCACATGPKQPPHPAVTVLEGQQSLPPPATTDAGAIRGSSRIGPFDTLSVDIFGVPELSKDRLVVDAGGRISLPLLGSLKVDQFTPPALEAELARQLASRGVRNPHVAVNFLDVKSQFVTVDGEVKKAGLYPTMRGMTLTKAIASAGGLDENAQLDNVVVFRTVGGQKMAALYNLKAIRLGYYEDPPVYSDDVVVVSASRARQLFSDVLGILPALTYVVVALVN
jgi:polysaccharide export outer membrane protein